MHRSFLLLICIFLTGQSLLAQKNKLLVALNPAECVSCINALKHIGQCDTSLLDINFVLEQKYKSDSDALVNSLLLNDYKVRYIWSDSLFKKATRNSGQSSVALLASTGTHIQAVSLKNTFGPDIAHYFNRLAQNTDTITFGERVFTSGVHNFKIYKGDLYTLDELKQELAVVNITSRKVKYRIKMDEDLARKAFVLQFNNTASFDTAKAFAVALGIPKVNSFMGFSLDKEGAIYIMGRHQYFYLRNGDTIGPAFYVLYKFDQDKLQKTYLFNSEITQGELFFYTKPRSFLIEGSNITVPIARPARGKDHNYFLAQMRIQEDCIIFDHFFDAEQPGIYKLYGYNLCDPKFSNGFVSVTLADRFYSLTNPDQFIHIGYFPEEAGNDVKTMNYRMGINDFRVDEKYVYMIYWNGDRKTVCFLKYDIAMKKILLNKSLPYNRNYTAMLQIDDFDYNYVHVPYNDYTLIRMKMEEE